MKSCPISSVLRENKRKNYNRYHYIPIRMTKIKMTHHTKSWKGCERPELSHTAGGNAKCYHNLELLKMLKYPPVKSPNNLHPWYFLRAMKTFCACKGFHMNVYRSLICYSPKLEAPQISHSS